MSQPVTWLSAFIDCRPDTFAPTAAYWSQVTGFPVSAPRGASDEFVSLLPAQGDDFLRIQRREEGESRIHLDLSVAKPRLAADEAVSFGARELVDNDTHIAMESPGGLVFCFVSHGGSIRPEPAIWAGAATEGHRSAVYQVCIDIPAELYAAESHFWGEVMGASAQVLAARPEFSWLRGDRQLALDVLLQRLDSPDGQVTAHLDLGTNDRAAEVSRHLSLGGERLVSEQFWTTMRDPTGLVYCITGRDPATGRLVAATVNS
jgi:Glyoxalase-like domain